MFFGFGRTVLFSERRMSLEFTSFPLWFPLELTPLVFSLWLFSLGNVLAFAPFGILIPDCFPDILGRYRKSLLVFTAAIVCLECVQYYTRLGIFDIEDIVINMIGYSIGYWSWRMSHNIEDKAKKAAVCMCLIVLITFFSICLAEILNWILFMDPRTNLQIRGVK